MNAETTNPSGGLPRSPVHPAGWCAASRAFTLVELVAVIVILAVLAGIAVPQYIDYRERARAAACKAILSHVREAIHNYRLRKIANLETSGTTPFSGNNYTGPYGRLVNGYAPGQWPTLLELSTPGEVLSEPIPQNPYNAGTTVRSAGLVLVATGEPYPVSGTAGWAYSPDSGEFWANSETTGVDESAW